MMKKPFNHMLAFATTVALVSGSQAVYAQNSADSVEEVLVTGFRASLENSIGAKREATSIIDSVYAEDIGKLPDTSIAESLARWPH
jgi:iron complex outermembrane receptor protein